MSTQVEIQRFNGFTAVDGTVHKTHALAVAHTVEIKTKEALRAASVQILAGSSDIADVMGSDVLAEILFEHREALRAALDQKVVLRKPRAPNKTAKAS